MIGTKLLESVELIELRHLITMIGMIIFTNIVKIKLNALAECAAVTIKQTITVIDVVFQAIMHPPKTGLPPTGSGWTQ